MHAQQVFAVQAMKVEVVTFSRLQGRASARQGPHASRSSARNAAHAERAAEGEMSDEGREAPRTSLPLPDPETHRWLQSRADEFLHAEQDQESGQHDHRPLRQRGDGSGAEPTDVQDGDGRRGIVAGWWHQGAGGQNV